MVDALYRGQEVGKAIGKPAAIFTRTFVSNASVVKAPFWIATGACTTKRFGIVVGANTTAAATISFVVSYVRAGVATPMKSFTLGTWTALQIVELGTDAFSIQDDDVFTLDLTNTPATNLPGLMVFVSVQFGG